MRNECEFGHTQKFLEKYPLAVSFVGFASSHLWTLVADPESLDQWEESIENIDQ